MSKSEKELIRIIREHGEPEKALMVAVKVIISFLAQCGSSEELAAAYPPGPAGTD